MPIALVVRTAILAIVIPSGICAVAGESLSPVSQAPAAAGDEKDRDAGSAPAPATTVQMGPSVTVDTKGVEFGPWIRRFMKQVKGNWAVPTEAITQHGHVLVAFDIRRDGSIASVTVKTSSNVDVFDLAARQAIEKSSPTRPLPPEYPADAAHFNMCFFYNETPSKAPPDQPHRSTESRPPGTKNPRPY
jgi:TonB family protein